MALYSVWDWDRNSYRVYATKRPASVGDDPVPPRPESGSVIGADPDTDVKPLPAGAKFLAYSNVARGEVRRKSSGPFDLGDDAGSNDAPKTRWSVFAIGLALGAGGLYLWQRRSQ
jgi:hypothetical protein